MRIAYITAGAAGMYCGSCINDNALARALTMEGHEVALVPTYTPTRTDIDNASIDRIFFGGINAFLEQRYGWYRRAPRPLRWLMDRKVLLNVASRFQGSTKAEDLGALTLSMLKGEDGPHAAELARLVAWLKSDFKPDVVHLTNAMFLGLAGPIRKALGCPIYCSLQGEDLFLQDLVEPFRAEVMTILAQKSLDVDGLIATGTDYADRMADTLGIDRRRIHAMGLGVELYDVPAKPASKTLRIGFLARQCRAKGLHHLLDAFRLVHEHMGDAVELRVAGYVAGSDRAYLEEQKRKVADLSNVHFREELGHREKLEFMADLDLFCIPTEYEEAKGISVLEALASGVPVVQPDHGAFPEIVNATGGGVLVAPNDPKALAEAILELLQDHELRRELGIRGRQGVAATYTTTHMVRRVLEIYLSGRTVEEDCDETERIGTAQSF